MLPRRDGMEVLAALRQKNVSVPVLILTSKDTVKDRVRGLDAGADDYLVKPFAFSELLARVRALSAARQTGSGDTLTTRRPRNGRGRPDCFAQRQGADANGARIRSAWSTCCASKVLLSPAKCSRATSGRKPSVTRRWTT